MSSDSKSLVLIQLKSIVAIAMLGFACGYCAAQKSTGNSTAAAVDVSAHIRYVTVADTKAGTASAAPDTATRDLGYRTVVWLLPADGQHLPLPKPGKYTMKQQGKEFIPHLMIIPAGSTVSFPNADPFFHNVFSLFNGRRFDLGLYQTGQTRDIDFNRVGVSYIFCNIHPDMSAVIITLNTPYFALPDTRNQVSLPGMPAGEYTLQVWSESSSPEVLRALTRGVTISRANPDLGEILVPISSSTLADHLNKFGSAYDTHSAQPPY